MRLNQNDINIRLQYITCCLATKADELAKSYTLGLECADAHMKKLAMLDAMFEAIHAYVPQEVVAHGIINITSGNFGSVTAVVNAVTIGSANWNSGTSQTASDLAAAINALTSSNGGFTATSAGSTILIYAPDGSGDSYNLTAITANVTGNVVATTQPFDGGVDGLEEDDMDDNCLTEAQIEDMFEYASKGCSICFPAGGTTYANATTGVSYRITQLSDLRITEGGDFRIIE